MYARLTLQEIRDAGKHVKEKIAQLFRPGTPNEEKKSTTMASDGSIGGKEPPKAMNKHDEQEEDVAQ
jgi:hypothetical protein